MELPLFLKVVVGLSVLSLTYGLPLPRFVYQQEADPSAYWELRPASRRYVGAPETNALYRNAIQDRFDPDRSYIQMIVPAANEIRADTEAKPKGPFGPTSEPPTLDTDEGQDDENEVVPSPPPCINGTINGTNTTCNETVPSSPSIAVPGSETVPPSALLMLADGTTLYSVGMGQRRKNGPSPSGTYELAYVAHRPRIAAPQPYPAAQYADFNRLGSIAGSPPLSYGAGMYEPVYIYKPVYPSAARSYDVYYYLPVDNPQSAEIQSKPKTNKKADKELEPKVEAKIERKPNTKKAEANEITMANAVEEADLQEQALIDAFNSQLVAMRGENLSPESKSEQVKEEVNAEETKLDKVEAKTEEDLHIQWEEELDKVSNEDLISAVERVLQQLHNRLLD